MKFISVILLTWSCFNLACVYESPKLTKSIQVLSQVPKKNCRLLGEVQGRSIFSYTVLGQTIARDQALVMAKKLGASHVLWEIEDSGLNPLQSGKAYLCRN